MALFVLCVTRLLLVSLTNYDTDINGNDDDIFMIGKNIPYSLFCKMGIIDDDDDDNGTMHDNRVCTQTLTQIQLYSRVAEFRSSSNSGFARMKIISYHLTVIARFLFCRCSSSL